MIIDMHTHLWTSNIPSKSWWNDFIKVSAALSGKPEEKVRDKMPGWLVVLLSILGVAILGPPAFVLVMIALGVAFSVGVALLKVSVVALGIAAIVMLLRAMFGKGTPTPRRVQAASDSIDAIASRLEEEERVRREHLDRELADALSSRSA